MTESTTLPSPRLPNPWAHTKYRSGFPSTLISELNMMQTSNVICEMPNWWRKCLDPKILDKWKTEPRAAGEAAAVAVKQRRGHSCVEDDILQECPRRGGAKDAKFNSKRFQWLPTDFDITPDGKIKAKSYINNLYTKNHKEMYLVLEQILDAFPPMFEVVLGEMRFFETKKKRLTPDPYGWYGEDPPGEDDFSDDEATYDYMNTHAPQPASVSEFTPPPETPKYDLRAA
ncbi:hypothetical protein BG015_009289 [Linnemannia schmuckeri]|uniref:Uncharacterized protein n=1 Tax=Linnemannia schmuckeri TaxID=64567 RepID=A0A9P5RW48_9FUNG|nr:hypothetical protein BG015_009289 [Linnemannia schmuckeri]